MNRMRLSNIHRWPQRWPCRMFLLQVRPVADQRVTRPRSFGRPSWWCARSEPPSWGDCLKTHKDTCVMSQAEVDESCISQPCQDECWDPLSLAGQTLTVLFRCPFVVHGWWARCLDWWQHWWDDKLSQGWCKKPLKNNSSKVFLKACQKINPLTQLWFPWKPWWAFKGGS